LGAIADISAEDADTNTSISMMFASLTTSDATSRNADLDGCLIPMVESSRVYSIELVGVGTGGILNESSDDVC